MLCSIQKKGTSGNKNGGVKNEREKLVAYVQQKGEKVVSSVDGMSNSFYKYMRNILNTFPHRKKTWTCYRCGESGHLARKCTKYQNNAQPLPVRWGNGMGQSV